ncbi:SDR family oxidoreductase [Candidatus Bipolaricaulota bacterium]|nr:SDR family oxidoreductase [Candidatus Bipolaricaulota bacterium]
MKEDNLNGNTALVTGGARRIGRRIALSLAELGVNVVIHYRSSGDAARDLKSTLGEKGVEAWSIQADFSSDVDYYEFVSEVLDRVGKLNYVINNASVFPEKRIEELEFSDLDENLEVNAWAPFALARSFADQAPAGKVVNLLDARIAGYDWGHLGYYFSKVMLARMTKTLALSEAPDFTVNGVAPGLVTPPPGLDESYLEKRTDRVPLREYGNKSDVAEAVIYLLGADFVTGQILYVDGGRNLLHELEG